MWQERFFKLNIKTLSLMGLLEFNLLGMCVWNPLIEPGGRGTPLHQVYRYVPPQRVGFLSHFGLKTGIDFEHFGLKLGMVIGNVHESLLTYFSSQQPERVTGEREREIDKIYHYSWFWRCGRHTPTKNFKKYPPPPSR